MHIVNIMFSYIAGGIEQAFVDYCEGLQKRGHKITAVTHPDAVINPQLNTLGITVITMRNYVKWDAIAMIRLRRLLQSVSPDIVIAHANRALFMTRFVTRDDWPLVGIAQNYTTKLLLGADGAFATTHDLIRHIQSQGVAEERIYHIPNMIRCHELPHRQARHSLSRIGTMGRFVKKKGFDIYIEALRLLKERGYRFEAILGGSGIEEKRLKEQALEAGLGEMLRFPGWVEDKKAFYSGLDIFCLPSLHEPFGIVLLEAFIYGAPVVATDSEGPRDIITHEFNALIVKTGSAEALADACARLLDDAELAENLAANAFAHAKTTYDINSVAERIESALEAVGHRWAEDKATKMAA